MQEALHLQNQVQGGDHETYPDDKRKVGGREVLPTKVRECTHISLPKTVWPPQWLQMQEVWRDSNPALDAGAPLSPLQPVERPAESTMEGCGKGDRLESGQMPTRACL